MKKTIILIAVILSIGLSTQGCSGPKQIVKKMPKSPCGPVEVEIEQDN